MKYLAIACILMAGCKAVNVDSLDQHTIVCTTGIIGDAVKNLVNDSCQIKVLMGPGTDPHLYKPTKESLDLLAQSDLIVANGLHLEGRMQEILEKLSRTKPVIFVGDGVQPKDLIYADRNQNIPDPHIWFDVAIWQQALTHLEEELRSSAPACYSPEKGEVYLNELSGLNKWVMEEISEIPDNQRVLITAHDAFGYFGRAYGVEVIGLQGISTMAEYGIRDVSNLVDEITRREIKSIFIESSISSRSIEAVIAGCREKGFAVTQGGTLYSDALGKNDGPAGNYLGMVRHNVSTIKSALK